MRCDPTLILAILALFGLVVAMTLADNLTLEPGDTVPQAPCTFPQTLLGGADSASNPISWSESRDPATALLRLDLRPYGFFGVKVQTYRDEMLLEEQSSETIATDFQLVLSDPAHAVGWAPSAGPRWLDTCRITLYSWQEMLRAPADRTGVTYVWKRKEN